MKSFTIIDISWPISHNMTAYKDRHVVQITPTKNFESDGVRESLITLGSHTGTHIDAPAHFLSDGIRLADITLDKLYGPCRVIDCTQCVEKITIQDLHNQPLEDAKIILLKTKNSALAPDSPFDPNFVYLTHDAAQLLVDKKISVIGIDYLGIERNQPGHETHQILMNHDIIIIEGLRLQHVQPGSYTLCCLPLSVNLDAGPARAILLQ